MRTRIHAGIRAAIPATWVLLLLVWVTGLAAARQEMPVLIGAVLVLASAPMFEGALGYSRGTLTADEFGQRCELLQAPYGALFMALGVIAFAP